MKINSFLSLIFSTPVHPVKMDWRGKQTKIQSPFTLYDNNLGKLKIKVKDRFINEARRDEIEIAINKSGFSRPLAKETLNIFENKNIFGKNIEVQEKFRNKNLRLGELMRLMSVAQMNENKSPLMRIFSRNSAVYFHAKYKFQPDIDEYSTINNVINPILLEKHPLLTEFAQEAQQYKDEIWTTDSFNDEWLDRVNDFLDRYIQKVIEHKLPVQQHPINSYINMKLTRENLLKNRDFFNQLFTKHGIDYTI